MKLKITSYEKNRSEIVHLLNEICPNGIGIEIGVKQATFSHVLLSGWNNSKLYLVDPWEDQDKLVYDEDVHDHQSDYNIATQKLKEFEGRYEVVRKYSNHAHSNFANHSVDFIYVDGSHEYVDVKKDADEAFKIIKKDGIIIFDDFLWQYKQNLKKSITYAIIEFLYEKRKNLKILYSNYQIIVQKI